MPTLPNKIYDCPMFITPLQMGKLQIGQFPPPQTAAKQDGENCPVPLAFERVGAGVCQSLRASSVVSQFPSRTPNFLAPFTRRMPAASSGLSKPASAAS